MERHPLQEAHLSKTSPWAQPSMWLGGGVGRGHSGTWSSFPPVHRPGSLICLGDLVFQHPAPTSLEVLDALVLSVGSNKALAGSDLQVDPYSLVVGGELPFVGVEREPQQCVSRGDPQPTRSRSLMQWEGGYLGWGGDQLAMGGQKVRFQDQPCPVPRHSWSLELEGPVCSGGTGREERGSGKGRGLSNTHWSPVSCWLCPQGGWVAFPGRAEPLWLC